MSTLSREFLSRMRGRAARFTEEPERGSITLEQVIWTAIIAGGAVLVAGVVLAAPLSGEAERLAGESCGNDINHSLILSGVPLTDECSDIAEYWCFGEQSVCDSLLNDFLTVRLILDIPPASKSKKMLHG